MVDKLKSLYRFISGKHQTVHLDYKVDAKPRFPKTGHPQLLDIIARNKEEYAATLSSFLPFSDNIQSIKKLSEEKDENQPAWNNEFLPGLDIVGIYGMIATRKPKKYIEIGSGNSTKVARKAITDHNLDTQIISIDPYPRANIDHLSDQVIRQPFENLKDIQFILDDLNENDVLFIDNSHRVFPNSDAMICFLELLPNLKKGVIVHIHDIYLPFDYPQFMCDRFYNEQYMLAVFILANPEKYKTILPNYFISQDPEMSEVISPIWKHENLKDVETHGGSYWIQIA